MHYRSWKRFKGTSMAAMGFEAQVQALRTQAIENRKDPSLVAY